MTIRGGRSLRGRDDPATDQAHPLDDDWAPVVPPIDVRGSYRRPSRGSGGGGVRTLVRFLLFSLVLAAIVLVSLVTFLRPLISGAIIGWASDNPSALGIPFVADMVREDLGKALTDAPSADAKNVEFVVDEGATARTIATRLQTEGFLTDSRAFVFTAIERSLTDKLEAGTFILRRNLTPDQLVTALLQAKDLAIALPFRQGLRLEQVVAKLETLPVTMNVQDFYDLVKHPTQAILDLHPWLELPKGASLEGFLGSATYSVLPDVTPTELVNMMLDTFYDQVTAARMDVPAARGMSFYQIVTLASLVEREAVLDSERPLVAGVFQNRLNPKLFALGKFQSDATIFYVNDTIQLDKLAVPQFTTYTFWAPVNGKLAGETVPPELIGYDTYTSAGLMPGPICTPGIASIDAALHPDTKDKYLFFLAKNDGSKTSAFAKTAAEHQKNIDKYGTH